MRFLLVFPSRVSPTYVPLGAATLAAAAETASPGVEAEILDLNLAGFEAALAAEPGGADAAAFFRDPAADLSDAAAYDRHASVLRRAGRRISRLDDGLAEWLATDRLEPRVGARLDGQVAAILAREPDLVGISAVFPAQLAPAVALARALARAGGPPVAIGGAALSVTDVDALRATCPFVTAFVTGEGEGALADLLTGRTPASRRPAPAAWPSPDFSRLPLDRYFVPEPVLPVLASRGCRWRRCAYCVHNVTFGRYRRRPEVDVVDELERARERHGARLFYFADEYVDAASLTALSREILRRGLDVRFHVMGRPSEDVTPGVLETAVAAGLRWVSWGIESASPRLLELCRKGCTPETMERVLRDAAVAGVSNLAMLILGLPTSTPADLGLTLDFLDRVDPFVDAVSAGTFVLYANTALGRRAEELGLVPTGRAPALRIGGRVVDSTRVVFRRRGERGEDLPPAGADERERFDRHMGWLRGARLLERVSCEHYLRVVADRASPARCAG